MTYTQTASTDNTLECKAFIDACTPLVYRQNSFRITGLQVDASVRAIKRRIEDLKHAAELGDAGDEHERAFALRPAPSIEQIREQLKSYKIPRAG